MKLFDFVFTENIDFGIVVSEPFIYYCPIIFQNLNLQNKNDYYELECVCVLSLIGNATGVNVVETKKLNNIDSFDSYDLESILVEIKDSTSLGLVLEKFLTEKLEKLEQNT